MKPAGYVSLQEPKVTLTQKPVRNSLIWINPRIGVVFTSSEWWNSCCQANSRENNAENCRVSDFFSLNQFGRCQCVCLSRNTFELVSECQLPLPRVASAGVSDVSSLEAHIDSSWEWKLSSLQSGLLLGHTEPLYAPIFIWQSASGVCSNLAGNQTTCGVFDCCF